MKVSIYSPHVTRLVLQPENESDEQVLRRLASEYEVLGVSSRPRPDDSAPHDVRIVELRLVRKADK